VIQIEGLNKSQKALATIMWGMDSKEQVLSFVASLRGQHRRDAEVVMELMIIAILDDIDTVDEAVVAELDRIAKL
jgi:hypothetical protein